MAGPGTPASPSPKFVQELDVRVRARYPLVYLVTSEEQRVEAILAQLAETHGKVLLGWSVTTGFRRLGGSKTAQAPEGARDPLAAIAAIEKLPEPSLVVLKDFHPYLSDPAVVRAVRELAQALKSSYTTVVLVSPTLVIPPEIEKEVSVLDVPLPTTRDLLRLLKEIVDVVRQGNRAKVDLTKDDAEQLVRAALGLTLSEAENAFAKAIANDGRLSRDDVALVLEEKRQVIQERPPRVLPDGRAAPERRWARPPEDLARPPRGRLLRGGAPLRPARAEGAPPPRRAGLRQEPHREGDRRPVAAAAAPARHGTDLQRARGLLGGDPPERHRRRR